MFLFAFRANEIREKVSTVREELQQLDMDIEENQGKQPSITIINPVLAS